MPPPGHESFLQAICESPADDAPRLVYADWLEENGDPERAEFIRLQIDRGEAKSRGEQPTDPGDRYARLRPVAETRWRSELPKLSGVQWQRFWRGFVSGAAVLHWDWFRTHADTLFAATPVEFLGFFGVNDRTVNALVRSPYLPRLAGLTLSEPAAGLSQAGWLLLLDCPGFANLRELVITGRPPNLRRERWFDPATIDEPVARLICSSPLANRLDRLFLRHAATQDVADILEDRFQERLFWTRPPSH